MILNYLYSVTNKTTIPVSAAKISKININAPYYAT